MDAALNAPYARDYHSQGLRLHFTDWGNPSAPPLILRSRRSRSLAQLGSSGAGVAGDVSCRGAGPSRARRVRLGERQQLQPGRSRLRSGVPGEVRGLRQGHDRRPFDGRDGQHDLRRGFSGEGVPARRARRRHQLSCKNDQAGGRQDRRVGRRSRQVGATENPPLSVGGRWRRAGPGPQSAADARAGGASRHPRPEAQ